MNDRPDHRRRPLQARTRRLQIESLERRALLSASPILGNTPPELDPIADQSAVVGELLTFQITADDLADDPQSLHPLTYLLDPNETPAGAKIDRSTGVFSWTPTLDELGVFRIVAIVTDRGVGRPLADAQVFRVTVTPATQPNVAPVITLPAGPFAVPTDTDLPISGIAVSDTDGGSASERVTLSVVSGKLTISSSVVGGVSAAQITSGNGTSSLQLDAPLAAINATLAATNGLVYRSNTGFSGSDTLTVLANDLGHTGTGGNQTDTKSLTLTIGAPHFNSPTPQTVAVGQPLQITIAAVNPNGEALTYQLLLVESQPTHINNSGTATVDPLTGAFAWTPNAEGSYSFLLGVTNADGLADTTLLSVTVTQTSAPVTGQLSIPMNLSGQRGESISVPLFLTTTAALTAGNGIFGADFVIHYDPTVLIPNPGTDPDNPDYFAQLAAGWSAGAINTSTAGTIIVTLFRSMELTARLAGTTPLATLRFAIQANAPLGSSILNLGDDSITLISTASGSLPLDPLPTNSSNDVGVDGLLTVT